MEHKTAELRRLLADAEAVRSGSRPQKQTPEDYEALRKHLGVHEPSVSTWGIWDHTRQSWLPDPLKSPVDKSPARYKSRTKADIEAGKWRELNPDDTFEVLPYPQGTGVRETRHVAEHRVASSELAKKYPRGWTMAKHLMDWSYRRKGAIERISVATIRKQGYSVEQVRAALMDNETFERFDGTTYIGSDGSGGMWRVEITENVTEARAPHLVADFNTLDDLIEHAGRELGATHVEWEHDLQGTRLFFPRKDGQFEVANTWQKAGYWHATGPGHREIVRHLPQGAQSLGGVVGRLAKTGRVQETGDYGTFRSGNGQTYTVTYVGGNVWRIDGHGYAQPAAGIALWLQRRGVDVVTADIEQIGRHSARENRTLHAVREGRLAQRFRVGSRVVMSPDALANYGDRWQGIVFKVTHVSTAYMPSGEFFSRGQPQGYHPGFDPEGGSALYDLAIEATGEQMDNSFYDWELESAPGSMKPRRRPKAVRSAKRRR
jgi:hypothetical protein